MNRYGICCGADRFALAAEKGFGYVEPALASLHNADDALLASVKRRADEAGVRIDGFNCFFGGEIMLHRDAPEDIAAYAERNFEIARKLEASYCVIGSGRSRAVPEGADRGAALENLRRMLDMIGTAGKKHGIRIFVEPLQKAETNLINTFSEGLALCRSIGSDNVGCMLDLYHFYMNGEDLSELDEAGPGELCHVHIARPDPDRGYLRETDREKLTEWANKLKSKGYGGRISIECTWGADIPAEFGSSAKMLSLF